MHGSLYDQTRQCSFAYLLPYLCSIPWPGLYTPYGSPVIFVLVELVLPRFIKCRHKRSKIKLNISMKTIAIRTHRIISFQSVRIFISPRLYSMYHIVCSYCVLNLLWVFKGLYHKSFMRLDLNCRQNLPTFNVKVDGHSLILRP